jgi:hypothetical protein
MGGYLVDRIGKIRARFHLNFKVFENAGYGLHCRTIGAEKHGPEHTQRCYELQGHPGKLLK